MFDVRNDYCILKNKNMYSKIRKSVAFRTWGGSIESAKSDLARAKELNMYVVQGIFINDTKPLDNIRVKAGAIFEGNEI